MKKEHTFTIKEARIPNYYEKFSCIAQKCQDTCCVGWNIDFDANDYAKIKKVAQKSNRLRDAVDKGVIRMEGQQERYMFNLDMNGGTCLLLDLDGLCGLQLRQGHDALPEVCREYPRRVDYMVGVKTPTLYTSCEGVLEALLELPEGVKFTQKPLPESKWKVTSYLAEGELVNYSGQIRQIFLDVLQDRSVPVEGRILALGVVVKRLIEMDWDTFNGHSIEKMRAELGSILESVGDVGGSQGMFVTQYFWLLCSIINKYPKRLIDYGLLDKLEDGALSINEEDYVKGLENFKKAFSDREYFFENETVPNFV